MTIANNGVFVIVVHVPRFSLLIFENELVTHARTITEKLKNRFVECLQFVTLLRYEVLFNQIHQYIRVGHYQKFIILRILELFARKICIFLKK